MTTSDSIHAIRRFAHRVVEAVGRVRGYSSACMSMEDITDSIVTIAQAESRLASLRLDLMARAQAMGESGGHRTVADMISSLTHEDRGAVSAEVHLAESLERWELVGEALAAGAISVMKARVISKALDELATEPGVGAEVLGDAEQHLVSIAPDFTAKELRRLAQRVLDVVAPGLAEDREAKTLEAQERRALRRTSLTFHEAPDGLEGVTEIRARVPSAIAGRLRTHLEAYTAPRHLSNSTDSVWTDSGIGEHVPYHQRLGIAFSSMLETLDPSRLPIHGGSASSVVVTIPLADLLNDLGVGELTAGSSGDVRITAATARRLACTANILPVVLGGESEILDLGRSARLFSPAQRRAMAIRDKRCRGEGCTIPADWCEAHHYRQPWSRGGKTDLADGKLLCSWHHHRAHDTRYLTRELPNGDVRFTRRT